MGHMIKVIFYTRNTKMNGAGRVPIYMRVTINGERFNTATSRNVDPAQWSKDGEKLAGKSKEAQELNEFLTTLRTRAFSIQKKLINLDRSVTLQEFEREWHGIKEKSRMLLEIFQQHNDQVKELIGRQYSFSTWRRYSTSLDHTKLFMQQTYGLSDVPVNEIKFQFITDYEFWLKAKRKCNQNSTVKYLTNFKKIIHICLKNGWLDRDPFVGYKMSKRAVERAFLTEGELAALSQKNFSIPRVGQVRDIFLFCCYTGLAYVDVKNLTRTEIALGIDGEKWIFTHREKTDTASRVPLIQPALEILERYEKHPECENKGKLLPVLSNQKMNAYLKEIADLCGLSKTLTTHTARHTFATTVTLTNGVPIETVSKMLGHTSIKTTQHYAKLLDKKVSEDMMALKSKFNTPKQPSLVKEG